MARQRTVEPIDAEREFSVEELFFSLTDEKGVIRHGNGVFCRIAAYSEEELFGAPHNIIRHPDMPRAVFQLLWDTIKAGQTIAAYVKNMAKDGRYYWVLAVVMPCDGGYLSVRLKPTSPLITTVAALYADLLAVERRVEAETGRRREAIAASVERLGTLLETHGFSSYEAFMLQALTTETASRHAAMREDPPPPHPAAAGRDGSGPLDRILAHGEALDIGLQTLFELLGEFRSMSESLSQTSKGILATADDIRLLALNASITANGLGQRGNTLRVVAKSLGTNSAMIEEAIGELTRRAAEVVMSLDRLSFDVATTKLQSEVGIDFAHELLAADSQALDMLKAASLHTLLQGITRRTTAVFASLSQLRGHIDGLAEQVQILLRRNKALRFVQFAGEKEAASRHAMDSFGDLFTTARERVESTHEDCRSLDRTVVDLRHHVETIRAEQPEVTLHLTELSRWTPESGA